MTQVFDIKDVTNLTALGDLQVKGAGSRVSDNPVELIVRHSGQRLPARWAGQ
ncbi:hypothetical protein [Pseudomonas congelans]|uniref:hypothetical protein n=1 Tax=Pseudomonas congelans TaxID=200452 RepID=UPI001EFDC38F|nr:hypothetical protein [Pseudomonas congelans]